nr:uncharacterized protein LOC112030590 [Quercus suber]POF02088.1 hypothetical protein CFP56_79608 [Quercus suber]
MGGIFFGSYGLTVSMQGRVTDPRLREFIDGLRKAQKEGKNIKEFLGQGDGVPGARPRDNETFEMARQRAGIQEVWKQKESQASSASGTVVDDASPTGGMFDDEYMSPPAERLEKQTQKAQHSEQIENAWERLRRNASTNHSDSVKSSRTRDSTDATDSLSLMSEKKDSQAVKSEEQRRFDASLQRERDGKDSDSNGGV